MPSNSQDDKSNQSAETQVPAPVPQEYGATVSAVSALLSLLAFGFSIFSLYRSWRVELGSRFESAFGAPIRLELRSFERVVGDLRAFSFPSGKSVAKMKAEFEAIRGKLEEEGNKVNMLLREIDDAESAAGTNWASTFELHTEQAELIMQSVAHPSVATEIEFRAKAEATRDQYAEAIKKVRTLLDAQRATL
jgi:hypothetical protein